jgi:hypothetical protein
MITRDQIMLALTPRVSHPGRVRDLYYIRSVILDKYKVNLTLGELEIFWLWVSHRADTDWLSASWYTPSLILGLFEKFVLANQPK